MAPRSHSHRKLQPAGGPRPDARRNPGVLGGRLCGQVPAGGLAALARAGGGAVRRLLDAGVSTQAAVGSGGKEAAPLRRGCSVRHLPDWSR